MVAELENMQLVFALHMYTYIYIYMQYTHRNLYFYIYTDMNCMCIYTDTYICTCEHLMVYTRSDGLNYIASLLIMLTVLPCLAPCGRPAPPMQPPASGGRSRALGFSFRVLECRVCTRPKPRRLKVLSDEFRVASGCSGFGGKTSLPSQDCFRT